MPVIKNVLKCEIEPTVNDVCALISAVTAFHPGREEKFLKAINDAVNKRLDEIRQEKDRPRAVDEIAKKLGEQLIETKRSMPSI